MTWYFDPHAETMDVYDHTGTQVASDRSFSGSWSGDYPTEVLDVMRKKIEGSGQPTAYNQRLLVDAATGNIVEGTPPA